MPEPKQASTCVSLQYKMCLREKHSLYQGETSPPANTQRRFNVCKTSLRRIRLYFTLNSFS